MSTAYKILVIAPAHNQLDKRVNSSLEVMSQLFNEVTVVYEERFSLDKFNGIDSVKYCYIKNTNPRLKVLPKVDVYLDFIEKYLDDNTLVYIHEPGVLGLLIAKGIKNKNKNFKIIFDYHDYIPWDIFYQVGKITKNRFLRKNISMLMLSLLRVYLSRHNLFDGVVGISGGQINSLLEYLSINGELPILAVPNTRKEIQLNKKVKSFNLSDKIVFMWVGNIVDGRDLDDTIKYLDILANQYNMKFTFKISGRIISSRLFEVLKTKDYFVYCGEFKDDNDILNNLDNDINIGLFLGWKDEFNIGINEIGSPNKVYSYINVGIPVIYNSRLEDLKSIIGETTGVGVSSFDDFRGAVNEMVANYNSYKDEVIKTRENFIWDNNNKLSFAKYLSNFKTKG